MSEKTTSQSQQKTPDPRSVMFEQQVARMEAWFEELAKAEERSIESAQKAIDESSKLMKETLAYGARLRAEWRALAVQSSRRAAEMMTMPWVY